MEEGGDLMLVSSLRQLERTVRTVFEWDAGQISMIWQRTHA